MGIDPSEVRDRATAQAEGIGIDLLGAPNSKRSKTGRELRWGFQYDLVLTLSGEKRGLWFDHSSGEGGDLIDLVRREMDCSFPDAVRWLRQRLGIEAGSPAQPDPGKKARREAASRKAEAAAERLALDKRAEAQVFWNEASPLLLSPAERYLIGRLGGHEIPHPAIRSANLRFHPRPYSTTLREPPIDGAVGAILARMVDPATGDFVGDQRTFLNWACRKIERRMLGGSGIVKLADRPFGIGEDGFGICEGLEDGLRILDRLEWNGPLWVAMNAGNMRAFPLLPGVLEITILADHDRLDQRGRRTGNDAAAACQRRWLDAGRKAAIALPGVEGEDWDDALGKDGDAQAD